LHYARIVAHDVERPEVGPVFEVPITVIKPRVLAPGERALSLGAHDYTAGEVRAYKRQAPREDI
jgi:hypothetical protein